VPLIWLAIGQDMALALLVLPWELLWFGLTTLDALPGERIPAGLSAQAMTATPSGNESEA